MRSKGSNLEIVFSETVKDMDKKNIIIQNLKLDNHLQEGEQNDSAGMMVAREVTPVKH